MSTSYKARIISALNKLGHNGTASPAKSNTDTMLGEAYMWDEVVRFAKARSDAAWNKLEAEGLFDPPTETGRHALVTSASFVLSASVSNPVKRFSADTLALSLKKPPYKIPEPVTKLLVEEAKIPTKPNVSYAIEEKA